MIKSMTGFGRSENQDGHRRISVEVKSVNHRYLDLSLKMPRKLNAFEGDIRTLVKKYTDRGKLDMYISYEDCSGRDVTVKYNRDVAAEYVRYMRLMAEEFGLSPDISLGSLAARPEVFAMEEASVDEEELWNLLKRTVEEALEAFCLSREREGDNLRADLLQKLDDMAEDVAFITEKSPLIIEEYRTRLREKVSELIEDSSVDENRLVTELVIYADKTCVDEELVRLKSHISQMRDGLSSKDSIGRKLDFIAQEMNREANTILSKTTDLEVSNRAISLKTGIEKIREQVQNIE